MTKVYEAERAAFGKCFAGRDVGMALTEARELIHRYLPDLEVRHPRGSRPNWASHYNVGTHKTDRVPPHISLGKLAGKPIVLHELAHALTYHQGDKGHGPLFRSTFLALVEAEMGERWRKRLQTEFQRVGYKV